MRVVYNNFPIYNSNGSVAGVLDGEYEAIASMTQERGWYTLHQVGPDGEHSEEIAANFNVAGGGT